MSHGRMARELRNTFGRMPDEPLPDFTDVPASAFEFYTPPGTYFDLFPIHLLTTSSLRLMSELNTTADWDVRRFRPNILVDTGSIPGAIELGWAGKKIRAGGFTIKGEIPTVRCAMPMHPQGKLPRNPSVLRTIVREANQCLGLYASVLDPGRISVGEVAEVA
jgi:uncharacterized protein YcbX